MTARPKRTFSREFKLQVVRSLLTGEKRFAQVCRELAVNRLGGETAEEVGKTGDALQARYRAFANGVPPA